MKLVIILSLFLLEQGIADDFNHLNKDVQKEYKTEVKNRCIDIGKIAGEMALLKWASRKVDNEKHRISTKDDELNTLTKAYSNKYKALKLSNNEVNEMAITIRDYSISSQMEIDLLSYKTYYQTYCELKENKKQPKQVKDIYVDMSYCWAQESQTGIQAEHCIEALVAGEKGTVDSNLKLLIEGKNMLKNKKAKLAIDNYFNLVIQNCTKENASVDHFVCADATFHKGSAYIDMKELTKAKQWVNKAIKLLPQDSKYVTELAFIYQSEKNLIKALETYKKAENVARKNLDYEDNQSGLGRALRGEGFILIEMGQLKEAKECFNKALKINPNDKNALHELNYIESLE